MHDDRVVWCCAVRCGAELTACSQGVPVDYLIDCVFCPVTQRLYLLGGTFDGGIKVIHVNAVCTAC